MDQVSKRKLKESQIIDAAEKVFNSLGYENTKMEDVAAAAEMSKGSVYFYFKSKENLFMAITYRAFQHVIELFYHTIEQHQQKIGLDIVLEILRAFISFSEQHFLHSEAMLKYIAFVRSTSSGENDDKLTQGMKESIYYRKIQDIQHIPMSIIIDEIRKGLLDGSIKSSKKPEILYLTAWATIIGYVKLNASSGNTNRDSFMSVNYSDWKEAIIEWSRIMLVSR
jgi:AcrR family transcriptional regulator